MESNHDDVVGQRATGQPGSRPARHKWQFFVGEESHYRDDFLAGTREYREFRLPAVTRQAIGVIDEQFAWANEYVLLADDLGEAISDC
jgi:hypothetical protein